MGQLVTTVVGGFAGFLIGGPLGAQIGMTLGGMVGSTLFGPTIKGPRLNDLKVSASTYGTAIPEVYGTVRVGGNMIWTTGIKETKKKSRAGKGGPKQETYSYDCTFAVGLCKGPINDITRIWADGKLIYDKTSGSTRNPAAPNSGSLFGTVLQAVIEGSKKKDVVFRLYKGTEDQLPDSLIEADKGAGNVSAHRGLAYVVFERLQLEPYGNRVPQLTFEVTKAISNSFPSIKMTTSGGESLPQIGKRKYFPDWETGRLLAISIDHGADIIDMNTMSVLYHTDESLWFTTRDRLLPGSGVFLASYGASNAATIQSFSAMTLQKTDEWGNVGGWFSGVDVPNGRYALGNYGAIGYGHYKSGGGQGRHIIATTWTRHTHCLNGGEYPVFFDDNTPFVPWFYYEGKTDGGSSDIIGYRGANGRLEVLQWSISGSAAYQIVPGPAPNFTPTWKGSTEWTRSTTNVNPFPGESLAISVCLYDPTDDCLFVVGTANNVPCTFKWNRASDTFKFARKHPGMPLPPSRMDYSRIAGGTFGYGFSAYRQEGKMIEIDLQNGDLIRNAEFGNAWGGQLYFGGGQQWDDLSKSLLCLTSGFYRRIFFSAGVTKLTIGAVVRDIALKSNVLTDAEIDITGLNPDTLVGYLIDRETSARDAIKQLATGFLFDGYESDYKLKFRSRGNASVVTIPEDWMGRNSDGIVVKETLTQELEMPMRVTVNYYDTTRDHQQGSQTMKRKAGPVPTMWTSKEDIVELPITWTPDEAKQCADKLLKMTWANRTAFDLDLPWRYLKYDPTDVVTAALNNGTTYVIRLSEATIGADFHIDAKGVSEKATAYVSTAKGAISDAPVQSISGNFPAFPIIVNTPLLRDIDYDTSQNSLCYLSAGTLAVTFSGAAIYMDDGYDFTAVGVVSSDSVTGTVINKLPVTKAHQSTDEDTVLIVRLNDPEETLESVTQDDMLNNFVNGALIGKEVIQFRDAVQQEDGSWRLSGILRARRGTEYAVNDHGEGEQFMLLDASTMTSFYRPPADYNVTREFKAVPNGALIEDATGYQTTLSPRDLMPYTPEDIKIDETGSTITVSMSRRSRITAGLADNTANIHYKEGEKTSAKITYKVWAGLTIDDTATVLEPDFAGTIPLFDAGGNDIPAALSFDIAALGGETTFLLRLTEVGIVEGTPKWIAFERLGANRWNAVDLY